MTAQEGHPEAPEAHSELTILDAGPVLNFMGRKETATLYMKTLAMMTDTVIVPDAVVDEVTNKSRRDPRFELCGRKLGDIIKGGYIEELTTPVQHKDEEYDFHWAWVTTNCPSGWLTSGKHRGEMVLVAHARHLTAQGRDVVAMIDDGDAIALAERAGIPTFSTVDLFHECVQRGLIPDMADLKRLYGYVEKQDDGLVSFNRTTLKTAFTETGNQRTY
ncbi:hypothetical protein [Arthrobacter sp. VKM Ac-2550]|uniref:hypothetical protein n=1 Tax=Crystallibacter permensis TaxID=1938888 RepID=UPI0022268650|nr:hypothetical protein [Arthrobacter sp. VKM Ac-2550]MCW2135018.1 hypothetical protein [Arthrobacter sp. VKM Ac-2550]